jgi:hypothetical protein
LEAVGARAGDECIRALPEGDTLLAHLSRQPMMLIEADACRERQVWRYADEHPSPVPVVDVEIVLDDPSLGDVKMPAIGARVANSGTNEDRKIRSAERGAFSVVNVQQVT